jgi:phosphoglycolate phosphatase-like HAD superfamily hydrolase
VPDSGPPDSGPTDSGPTDSGPTDSGPTVDPGAPVDPLDGIDLVVFDKDGTLVDFDAMWVPWVTEIAARLEAATGLLLAEDFYDSVGFDAATGRTIPGGGLSGGPMSDLREQTVEFLRDRGLDPAAAESAVDAAWFIPDPVATAQPLADLPALFSALRERGLRIAVATSDDHAPTEETLAALGLSEFVDGIVAADDDRGVKPAPELLHWLAETLGVEPARMAIVGDTPGDLRMGRAAGAGRSIGVLTGVSSREELEPLADLILPSIEHLRRPLVDEPGPASLPPPEEASQGS